MPIHKIIKEADISVVDELLNNRKRGTQGINAFKELLESMIETMDVLLDGELLKGISEAEEDIKAGRVRRLEDFEEELRRQGLFIDNFFCV